MVRLPQNEKQTYRLNSRAQMWPSALTLAMTLTSFSRSNMEFAISQPKMIRLPRNEQQTYWLNSRAQMWPSALTLDMTLTFNFQGHIWNLLYLSQKWSDCHGTKSKHIDWTPRPQMWPSGLTLATTLTLNFQGQIWNFPISQPKVVRLPRNEKQTYRLNSRPQMWPMGLTLTIILTFEIWRSNVTLTYDHTHDLDHGFSWSNFEIAVSQNGRADWHCTNGVAVGHSWPWPWPFGD